MSNCGARLSSALAQAGRIVVEINGLRPRSATGAVDIGPTILTDDGGDSALCGSSTEARVHAHSEILEKIELFLKTAIGQGG